MVVLLNGAFGIGKTTVARLVVRRLPRTRLFDRRAEECCAAHSEAGFETAIPTADRSPEEVAAAVIAEFELGTP